MTLPGLVFSAPDGVRGFDTAERVNPSAAAAFRRSGYRFCVRYVRRDKPHASALSATEARSLLNIGIGLMLVQYVESDTSWIPSGGKGTTNGSVAASEAAKLGVPWGVTTPYRFRFHQHLSAGDAHDSDSCLVARDTIQQWRSLAKDGADLPLAQSKLQSAVLVIHPGETYDFEVMRQRSESLTMKVLSPETITTRLAFRARGVSRAALPRATMQVPLVVR